MKIPAKDYPRFQGVEVLNKDMADNADIRRAIIKAVPDANRQVKGFAKHFGRNSQRETCKAIYDFLKNDIRYVADGSEQVIKLPSALLKTKVGDCKSYSLLTSAILTNLGIPHHFVLASYNQDPTPSHIYVQLDDGCIIDAVWGIFDSEKKPTYRYEVKPNGKMKVKTLTGLGNTKPIGNPLIYAALAAAPAIIESVKGDKKKVTGLGGCGCGTGMNGCGCGCDCPTCKGNAVGLGAFELDAASKAYCDRTYPVKNVWLLGDTNKILREGCYARERVQDQAVKTGKQVAQWSKDLNLKQYVNAPFRELYLSIIRLNVDGYATRLEKNPKERVKLQNQFTRWGGDGNKIWNVMKIGASKKPLKLGIFTIITDKIKSVLPKGVTGTGIGETQTGSKMTAAQKQEFTRELMKFGMEVKDWDKMTKEEKAKYISNKLTTGTLGGLIRTGLDAAVAAGATAICTPLNIAAAACTPVGALIGESIYAQIPSVVNMIVMEDDSYNPVPPSGDNPSRVSTYDTPESGDSDSDTGDSNTMLYLVGGSIAGYLLYTQFLKK